MGISPSKTGTIARRIDVDNVWEGIFHFLGRHMSQDVILSGIIVKKTERGEAACCCDVIAR